jgi:putative exosortase-associated protein (TIGR04073 family)
MKKVIVLVLLFMFLVVGKASAANQPTKKLLRGVTNVLTAPVEVVKQTRSYWIKGAQKTPHIIVWLVSGAVWGTVQTVKRAGSGAWDVVTFPFAKPEQSKALMHPDYVFQEWPKNPVSGR